LINGVLVERTVKDVIPAVKTNQEGLRQVLDDMVKQYKTKQDELDKWKVRAHPPKVEYEGGQYWTNNQCYRKRTMYR
jgi:predicted phage tail protein